MKIAKKALLSLALSAIALGSHAFNIREAHENEGLSQVYLSWENPANASTARYNVERIDSKNNTVMLAVNLVRLQFIDTGVLPGSYTYRITNTAANEVVTTSVSVSARKFEKTSTASPPSTKPLLTNSWPNGDPWATSTGMTRQTKTSS